MRNREQATAAVAAAVIFALAAVIAYFVLRPASPSTVTIASIPPTATPIPTPSATPVQREANAFPLTITDGVGRQVQIQQLPRRFVVVGAGLLDMCSSLGINEQIVGVADGSDAPDTITHVGDERHPDGVKIAALNPDLVIISDSPIAREVADALIAKHIPALLFNPRTVEDVISTVGTVGRAVGSNAAATAVTQDMTARLNVLRQSRNDKHPLVFYEVDASNLRQPLTVAPDSFIGSMIAEAGGQVYVPPAPQATATAMIDDLPTDIPPLPATDTPSDEPSDEPSGDQAPDAPSTAEPTAEVAATPDNSDNPIDLIPTVTPVAGPVVAVPLDSLKQQPPDIIILGDTSLGITVEEAKQRPGWADIATIKAGRIYAIDPRLLRPGPRCIEGLEQLARIIRESK